MAEQRRGVELVTIDIVGGRQTGCTVERPFPALQNIRQRPAGDACGNHREQAAFRCLGLYQGAAGAIVGPEGEDQQREERLQAAGPQAG